MAARWHEPGALELGEAKKKIGREVGKEPGNQFHPSVYLSCDCCLASHVNSNTFLAVCVCVTQHKQVEVAVCMLRT